MVDVAFFILGVVLLAVPSPVLCTGEVRERLRQLARRRDDGIGSLLRSWVNWFDLIRGGGGVWLLQRALASAPGLQGDLAAVHLGVELGILTLVVAAQTIWPGRGIRVVGPVFFLSGFTLALAGPLVGAFALVMGFTCALMVKRLSLVFALVPLGIVAFGYLFHSLGIPVLFNAAVFLAPGFFAFAFAQRLGFVRRPSADKVQRESFHQVLAAAESKLDEKVIRPDFGTPVLPEPAAGAAVEPDGMVFEYPHDPALRPLPH